MGLDPLRKIPLGSTDVLVSRISFGSWGVVDGWGNETTPSVIVDIMNYAWELGINLYDTAGVYGNGLGEEIFQKLPWKNDAIIATKISSQEKPISPILPIMNYYKKDYIEKQVDISLKRLGRDFIDILQLHNWFTEWDNDFPYVIEVFNKLKTKGKLRLTGISIPRQTLLTSNLPFLQYIDVAQVPVNIFDEGACKRIIEISASSSIGILARSVLQHGLISNNIEKIKSLQPNDFRKRLNSKDGVITPNQLLALCTRLNIHPINIPFYAISNILQIQGVSSAIVGIRKKEHLTEITNKENYNF